VHAGSNHDQHPVPTSHDNEPGHAARLWEGSTVPSLDKVSAPGIAVVQDSLGLDYSSFASAHLNSIPAVHVPIPGRVGGSVVRPRS